MILKYFFNTTRRAGRPLFTEKEKSQARRFHITTYIRIAYIIPYSINTRNPNIIKRADSLFQILFFRSLTCLTDFHRQTVKNHSSMTIKIFMSNVSEKVKSKINNTSIGKDE